MGHPGHNVGPLGPAQNALELGGELLQTHGVSVLDGAGSRVQIDAPSGTAARTSAGSGSGSGCSIGTSRLEGIRSGVGMASLGGLEIRNG